MTTFIFILNDILVKNKSAWYGTLILFVLAFFVRVIPAFISDTGLIYIVDISARILWLIIMMFLVIAFINSIITDTVSLKHEVIFYKAVGSGIGVQFLLKILNIFMYCLLLSGVFWVLRWSVDIKYFLLLFALCNFMVLMRLVALYTKNIFIYYSGLVLICISIFYPLYIFPNIAYMVKADIYDVIVYASLYTALYVLTSFRFYVSTWRKECIGWNY